MVTIGVAGVGDVSQTVAWELLDDFVKSQGGTAVFIFEITPEAWTQSIEEVTDFAFRNDHDYRVVTTQEGKADQNLKDVMAGSVPPIRTAGDPDGKFLTLLEAEDNPFFCCLFDPNDEPTVAQVTAAKERGLTVLDLCDGMRRLVFEGEEEPEVPSVETLGELIGNAEQVEAEEEAVEEAEQEEAEQEESEEETAEEIESAFDEGEKGITMEPETTEPLQGKAMTVTDSKKFALGLAERFDALSAYCAEWANGAAASNGNGATAKKKTPVTAAATTSTSPRRRGRAAKKATASAEAPKRRGRPPLPRDKDGNIIR